LLTTPSKSSPSEAMMVVLVYVVVLGEVALKYEKACLCCQPSRVLDAALQRLVRRPNMRCERGNVRLRDVRIIEGSVFATLPVVQKLNQLLCQPKPSVTVLGVRERTQAEPTSPSPASGIIRTSKSTCVMIEFLSFYKYCILRYKSGLLPVPRLTHP
jgi:hypothetical protein